MQVKSLRIAVSSVRKFINIGSLSRVWNLVKKFHAADIASLMEHLTFRERMVLFNTLYENDKETAVDVIREIEPEDAAQIFKKCPIDQITDIFHLSAPDDVAAIMPFFSDDLKETVLEAMEDKPSEDLLELLEYEEETAGRIMSPNFYALNQNTKVSDTITAMQLGGDVESAFYLYVVDDQDHLLGVVSIRQVLFSQPNTSLKSIMHTDLIIVSTDTDQEIVARNVADYNLVAIPVVDDDNVLVGVVTVDDIIDVIDKEATEDMYKMVSLDSTDRILDSPLSSIKKRLPFLLFSLLTASIAPLIVNSFTGTIEQVVKLAVFIPLVMALGGIAGNQTIAIIVREIAIGQTDWLSARKALLKEIVVGLVNGLVIGSITGILSFLIYDNYYFGLIIGVAIIINLFVAAFMGTLIPLILKLIKLDPALGSVNLLTMCTDSIGVLTYLGLGTIFLNHL
ncbi:MAG: magnesium transporter [Candidatus Aminicenantaceae bacterium]